MANDKKELQFIADTLAKLLARVEELIANTDAAEDGPVQTEGEDTPKPPKWP